MAPFLQLSDKADVLTARVSSHNRSCRVFGGLKG